GLEFSVFAGGTQADADGPAKKLAVDRGNNIVMVSGDDLEAWKAAAQPIYAEWVADMNSKGIDGQALIDEARTLIDKYTQ
ncbi:MAG: C4-dicarboxylate ABC transporter, partial [Pseudomonadota bacterium]